MTHVNEMYAVFTIIVFLLSVPITVVVCKKIINKIFLLAISFTIVWAILTNLNARFPDSVKCGICQNEILPTRNCHMSFVNVGKGNNETVYRRYFCPNCERFQLVKEIK